jgi:GNAT superfamily N-acetyltransferase
LAVESVEEVYLRSRLFEGVIASDLVAQKLDLDRLRDLFYDDLGESSGDWSLSEMAFGEAESGEAEFLGFSLSRGRLVALASYGITDLIIDGDTYKTLFVNTIEVDPDAERGGIGRAVVAKLEQVAEENLCYVLALHSLPEAEGFYRKLGMAKTPCRLPTDEKYKEQYVEFLD